MNASLPLADELILAHQSKITPLFDRFEEKQTLHSTLLFTGIEGVGKKSLALYLIQTLFCDQSIFAIKREEEDLFGGSLFGDAPEPKAALTGRAPCGKCPSCIRAAQNQWLDLFWFDPETNEEGTRLGTHKIDAFRELKSKLGMGPSEEPFRVVVIADADRMTPQAANSILKMLEEPPKNWIFILTASDSSRLLPTILSRCMEIKFNPLQSEQVYSILKSSKGLEFQSTRGQVASRAAMGSLTRAQSYLSEEVWELRDRILGLLSSPTHEWMKLIDSMAQSQQSMNLALDLIESIFSDLLQSQVIGSAHRWIHEDQKELLIQLAETKKLDIARLTRILSETSEKRKFTTLTLNGKLLAQEILIPILESL